jgi:signal transduction histidine kinase
MIRRSGMDADAFSRLLSLTSHELRSPLGVIRGYLKWLEQQGDALPEQQRQVVTATVKASDRLAELLAELSALAQLQRRETPLAREPVSIDGLVADLVAAVAYHRRPVRLTPGDVPSATVVGDRALLAAALDAVATAVSLARPRDTTLLLTGRRESPGSLVKLELVSPHPSQEVTEMPLNLTRGGVGLRLAIAAEIIDAHGGRLLERHSGGRLSGMIVLLNAVDP